MDKYKKLISNTVIFAIGTFSSKVLVFLLMPLYTRVLSDAEYGITDLIVQTGNLLLDVYKRQAQSGRDGLYAAHTDRSL